jgi:SH3-like domain-containing protein
MVSGEFEVCDNTLLTQLKIVIMKSQLVVFSFVSAAIAAVGVALPVFARPATLTSQNPNSRINVRSAPTTLASSPHYGFSGDRVEVLRFITSQDHYGWNYVQFQSGAKGWVRGDFVRYAEGMAKYEVLGGSTGDRINVRSSPSTSAPSPHYGIKGDVVQVLTTTRGRDGYTWKLVQFPSGAQGWIRGDLLAAMGEGGC